MINVHSPDELNCVSFVRCTNVCSAMNYLAFRSCFKKKLNVKSSHMFSFSFHWEFFSDFRKWSIKKRTSIKESYTSFKNNNLRIYYCLTRIPCTDLEDFAFYLFGNCRRDLDFAVVFRVNDGKYQNYFADANFCQIPHGLWVLLSMGGHCNFI